MPFSTAFFNASCIICFLQNHLLGDCYRYLHTHIVIAVNPAIFEQYGQSHDANSQFRGKHSVIVQCLWVFPMHVDKARVFSQLRPPLAVRLLHSVNIHLEKKSTQSCVVKKNKTESHKKNRQ
jgi:hypothetical protein